MKRIVGTLVRWSWLLVLCLLIGWFAGKELAKVLPPTYQATAIVQLNAQTNSSQTVQPVSVYAALVTSDSILNPILKQYPTLDRQTFVLKQLTVSSDNTTQIITIQVTLPDAQLAPDVANALAKSLVTQQNAYIKSQYVKQLKIINETIKSEQNTINSLNQQIADLAYYYWLTTNEFTVAMQQLNSELTQQQSLQSQAISSRQELATEQTLNTSPLLQVQVATASAQSSSLGGLPPPSPVLVFPVVMLILGLAAISLLELAAGRINGSSLLRQKTTLPILGSLRWTRPSPKEEPVNVLCKSKTKFAEDCRVMMADVLFHAEAADANILAITSLREKAGKSTVASQLAALLALSRRHVLLIDANLYSPSQNKRMQTSNRVGLATILKEARIVNVEAFRKPTRNEALEKVRVESMTDTRLIRIPEEGGSVKIAADDASGPLYGEIIGPLPMESYIISTHIPNLDLLPAGHSTINPAILLSMPQMGDLFQWAAQRYDFVVIDCPTLTYAETHVLGSLSDQTFVVVDATKDRVRQVIGIQEKLLYSAVRVTGLIVNKLGRF